ncbi:MAG: hypothetical protein NZZ41_02790 [Candidatus Dojkabacteria bacterium]|nr:hypothetical protein [Candidatus Dojkabacteria bacterium]
MLNGTHNVPDASVPCPPFSVTGYYYLQDYINQLHGAEIPVRRIFTLKKGIMNFLMDLKDSMDNDGKLVETAVFKELPGIQLRMAVDGTFYQRGEWYYERGKFHVTQTYNTPTNTIQVGLETAPGVYTPSL